MARNPRRKLLDVTKDGWRPYASAPFGPFTDDDDGTVQFGFQYTGGGAISVMQGWDFCSKEPTHWRTLEPPE